MSIILLNIYVSKNIVLNVLFIVEVFENKYYYIITYTFTCEYSSIYTHRSVHKHTWTCIIIWLLLYIFSVILCGKPVSIENANMSYDGDVIGSVVRYSCCPGHQLIGAATRICGNYTWSGKSPVCKGKWQYSVKLCIAINVLPKYLTEIYLANLSLFKFDWYLIIWFYLVVFSGVLLQQNDVIQILTLSCINNMSKTRHNGTLTCFILYIRLQLHNSLCILGSHFIRDFNYTNIWKIVIYITCNITHNTVLELCY